jgi:putative AlgH/UPF0301 family transcriptional regulator
MSMSWNNYQGHLIASHPCNPQDEHHHSVILMVNHTPDTAVGLRINQLVNIPVLKNIVNENLGIDYHRDDPLYSGGSSSANKIHVIHSMDWSGLSTVQITDEIGITNDISVFAALSRDEGPEHFKACMGFWFWANGHFDLQMNHKIRPQESRHRWEPVEATIENTFQTSEVLMWDRVIEESAKMQINSWF